MNHNGNNEHPQGGFTSAQPFELSLMGTRQKGPQGEKEAGTALTPSNGTMPLPKLPKFGI